MYTIMDEPTREVFAKVQIIYTDLLLDSTVTITTSEEAYNSRSEQTADNVNSPEYKWLCLCNNTLDGTYHPIGVNSEVGWWGTSLSDSSGVFSNPPWLAASFMTRALYTLKVVGDSKLGCYPVDFTIKGYDGEGELRYTINVADNTDMVWMLELDPPWSDIDKVELTVSKINLPNHPVRILEFYTSVVECYTDDDRVMTLDVIEEQEVDSNSLPFGTISANEINVTLSNHDKHFNPEDPETPLYGMLKPNRRVEPWYGVEVDGEIEWHPMGIYWITKWSLPRSDIAISLMARDRVQLLDTLHFNTSQVYQNYSLSQLAEILLGEAGLTAGQYEIDEVLNTYVVPYAWFEPGSIRQHLSKVAQAGLATIYATRDDKIKITQGAATAEVMCNFSEFTNLYDINRVQQWERSKNDIQVAWTSYVPLADQDLLKATDLNYSIAAEATLVLSLNYNQIPALSVDSISLQGGSHLVVSSYTSYACSIDIMVTNNGDSTETLTGVTVIGTTLTSAAKTIEQVEDLMSIQDMGRLTFALDNDLIQTKSLAQIVATTIAEDLKDASPEYELITRGNMALRLGDKVTVPTPTGSLACKIVRLTFDYDGALSGTLRVRVL